MTKRIIVVCGNSKQNDPTEQLAEAFIKGARGAGHEVRKLTLYNRNINACMECQYCHINRGVCMIKDAMPEIYEQMMDSDILVIATPVYFYSFPSKLKAVFDRMHNPIRNRFKIRETYLLTAYTDEGENVCRPMLETYHAIGDYLGWQDQGIIVAEGINEKEGIRGHEALIQAEEMGKAVV